MAQKRVYFFGEGKTEGDGAMKNLLGGKGAGLAEMSRLGIPVPAGFTITTEVCAEFYQNRRRFPKGLDQEVAANLKKIEKIMGATFGDARNPLLVSVRSGARVSMPGMMDTVLNLGLNDTTVEGLAQLTGNPRFAYDSYRRFVQMYGDVVLGLKPATKDDIDPFEEILEQKKHEAGVLGDHELDTESLKNLVCRFKAAILERTGNHFPEDPWEQLWGSVGAVFGSWNNDRAEAYRQLNGIPGDWGTAVNVQAMVFGNMGEDCGTGVLFSRDPATGDNLLYGEFLMNAQGEDVVAGIRTPRPIAELSDVMPQVHQQIVATSRKLERHFGDMQDMEFTIQKGKLWMLQTRTGKRTGFAAVRIAVDMVTESLIDEREAIRRIAPDALNQFLRPVFDADAKKEQLRQGNQLAKGLAAGPGAATGRVVFNAEDAEAWAARGEQVLLTRIETSPEDIRGMNAAAGILTARGGMTSHAALVARQMGKVCVAGCGELKIDYKARTMEARGKLLHEGDWISIDGTTGEVIKGQIKTIPSEIIQVLLDKTLDPSRSVLYQQYDRLMGWADRIRKLGVRTNADQPDQAAKAVQFGAQGIGLCRTEHMFFGEDKIDAMREMIIADNTADRERALAKLLPLQRADFRGIFEAMGERPVTIRTLDPPLHEFLPHQDKEIQELAVKIGVAPEKIKARVESLHEQNPMLGHRGCRLGITYPEITAMQARAILEAACDVKKQTGVAPHPEIMIPLVGHINELLHQERLVRQVAKDVFAERGVEIPFAVGTMIELPRAAVVADQIAKAAEFFSFGTNDLTQTTFGLSRDDAQGFLGAYQELKILEEDPFQTIDQEGVGQLMALGVQRGRSTKPNLKIGICGEHGGDPKTVMFCHKIGLNYVSCSPFRVPIARLAAAQAVIAEGLAAKAAKRPPAKKSPGKAKKSGKKLTPKVVKRTVRKAVVAKAPAKGRAKPRTKVRSEPRTKVRSEPRRKRR